MAGNCEPISSVVRRSRATTLSSSFTLSNSWPCRESEKWAPCPRLQIFRGFPRSGHVSRASAQEVGFTFNVARPETTCLEKNASGESLGGACQTGRGHAEVEECRHRDATVGSLLLLVLHVRSYLFAACCGEVLQERPAYAAVFPFIGISPCDQKGMLPCNSISRSRFGWCSCSFRKVVPGDDFLTVASILPHS